MLILVSFPDKINVEYALKYYGDPCAGVLTMNLEKVIFGFFIVLALTLNFGFFLGEMDNVAHHNVFELFAVIVVNFIATGLKLGDRSHIGAVLLATSLVADLQLIAAAIYWTVAVHITETGLTPDVMASIMSLSGGALLANVISVIMLVSETLMSRL
jgi:Ca2+/H+ antiporter, TMEM165/GDT1 family